jgi:hypothetical protein
MKRKLPANYIPMPLADLQEGASWPFRGRLVREDGGPPLPYPPEWERMRVWITGTGPGYVIERIRLELFELWTGMEFRRIVLMPPGRGWKRDLAGGPRYGWWAHWERRRNWVVE